MRKRTFIYTWWAGVIPDTFGDRSILHRARFAGARRAMPGGAARRGRPASRRRLEAEIVGLVCVPYLIKLGAAYERG